jgi:hypothetical protein
MSDEQPDLDLIQLVQRARMAHDAAATPSQVSAVYWLEAKPEGAAAADQRPPTPRAGRFVIETTVDQIDALWARIKAATQAGQLGYKSKVSTASRRAGTGGADRVIYVLTADAEDRADVERVRAALIALGMPEPLVYARVDEDAGR